jgi:hypothetical protein
VRRILAAIVALASLALTLPVVAPVAAANQLQITVRTGFDGMVRPGTWIPVEVNLANAGPNVSGNVELSVQRRPPSQNGSSGSPSVDYSVPVTIPEHSSKQFSTAVYIPPFFDQLQVQLVSGNQTLYRQNFPLQRIDPSQVSCGVLATDPTAFDSLNGLTVGDSQRQPHVVYLDLLDLPTNPQLLGSLDCLILSDYATRGLTSLQQTALSSWVSNGGVLTIGTGPSGASTVAGLPPDLLPASVDGTVAMRSMTGLANYFGATADQSGPWLIAGLKLNDGAVVVSDESQPLMVVGRRGKGAVFMFALSLTQKPLRGWDGFDHMWTYVLAYVPVPVSVFSSYFRQDYGWGRMPREALTRGGSGSGPESQTLLAGLLLFGLLIGPINFLVLSRLGRRELAILTVPVLAIGATAGALYYANHHRQGDVVINEVSLVRTWDGSGVGEAHSFVGVFALHPQTYDLTIPANELLSSTVSPFPSQPARTVPPVRVFESGAPEVQGLDLTPGTLSSFTLDSHMHETGRIRGTINLNGDNLTGQVVNGFSATIHDVAILAGDSVEPIGDLRPGASHSVELHLDSGSPTGYNDVAQLIDRLYPGVPRDVARRDVKYQILTAALNPAQSYTGQVELGGINLIGWLSDGVTPVKDPETDQDARQLTLFVTSLPFQLTDSLQTIPGQLIERAPLSASSSARVDATGLTVNSGDTVSFQYTAPIEAAHFGLRSLTLATSASSAVQGTVEAFNWRTQTWDEVPFVVGNLQIPNPDRYFSNTGSVRLRFHYKPTAGPTTITFSRFQLLVGGTGR